MEIILLCWGVGAIIGALWGMARRLDRERTEESEGEALVPASPELSDTYAAMEAEPNYLAGVLREALQDYRRRGGCGMPLLQLDCCVRAALLGNLDARVAVYLLEKIGAHSFAARIKGAGL